MRFYSKFFLSLNYAVFLLFLTLLTERQQSAGLKYICDALRDLVAFAQFKKREKHPWRSVNFSKAAG